MEDKNAQSATTQQSSTDPRLAHQKVFQSDASFAAEVRAPQQTVASPNSIYPEATAGLLTPDQTATPAIGTAVVGVADGPLPLQPARPELTYSEPRPTTNDQIPIGMSASQLGFSHPQSGTSRKTILKRIVAATGILAAVIAGILIYRSMTGFGTIKVHSSNGFTYLVTYNKLPSEVSLNGMIYLQGKDKSGNTMLMHVGKSTQATFDCLASTGNSTIIAKPVIEGQQHNLCYFQSVNAYEVNFTHNGTWYYLVIKPKDKSQTLDQDTVTMIASSVSVSQ